MQHVTAQVSRATMISRAKVLRYRPEIGDLLVEAGVGWKPRRRWQRNLSGRSGRPQAGLSKRERRSPSRIFERLMVFRTPDLLREHGIVAIINVPVLIDEATWGILEADSTQPGCFDQWDVELSRVVANIMGVCSWHSNGQTKAYQATAEAVRQEAQFEMQRRELQHRSRTICKSSSLFFHDGHGSFPKKYGRH